MVCNTMYPGGHGADVPGDLGGAAGERHPGDDGAAAGHRAGLRGAGDPDPVDTPPRPASPLPRPGGGVRAGAGLGGGPGQPPGHPHRGLHPAAELQPQASTLNRGV